jgi:hypothetical protein
MRYFRISGFVSSTALGVGQDFPSRTYPKYSWSREDPSAPLAVCMMPDQSPEFPEVLAIPGNGHTETVPPESYPKPQISQGKRT